MTAGRPHVHLALLTFVIVLASPGSSFASAPKDQRALDFVQRQAEMMRPVGAMEIQAKPGASPATDLASAKAPGSMFAQEFTTPTSLRDAAALADAQRQLLDAFSRGEVFQARKHIHAAGSGGGASTVRYILGAYDLSGDGLNDALTAEIDYIDEAEEFEILDIRLAGARGTDGERLWSTSLGSGSDTLFDTFVMPAPDLDGDKSADVLVLRLLIDSSAYDGDCTLASCLLSGTAKWRWVTTALSGADASTLWKRTLEGSAVLAYATAGGFVAGARAFTVEATNAAVLILATDGQGDDARADLVLNAFDLRIAFGYAGAGAFVAGAFAYSDHVMIGTRAEILRGGEGSVVATRTSVSQPGGAVLLPAGQAVGSPAPDFLWQTQTDITMPWACAYAVVVGRCLSGSPTQILALEMIDGNDMSSAWTARMVERNQVFAFAFPDIGDLDADGATDIVALTASNALALTAMSGADGSRLWSLESDAYDIGFATIGMVGGEVGTDVLVLEVMWDDALRLDLSRVDGATGEELFRTRPDIPYENLYVALYLGGDFDGDGVSDIVTEIVAVVADALVFRFSIESGRTGGLVYADDSSRGHSLPGDLDADGTDDLVSYDYRLHRFSVAVTTTALTMPAASQAWTRTDRQLRDSYLYALNAGDIDGVPGGDLFLRRSQYTADVAQSRYEGMSGLTGATQWGAGDTFTPPPPVGTYLISGAIRSEAGALLEGVCVEPYDESGNPLGASATGAEGAYSALELEAGIYRLHAYDCNGDLYRGTWHGGTSFETATPLLLAEDENLTGIDLVLPLLPLATNDLIEHAISIATPRYDDEVSTRAAGVEDEEPLPCYTGATIWYRVTPEQDGTLTATTFGSSFDTVLAVYEGEPSEDRLLKCSDDYNWDLTSRVSVEVTAGATYYVQAGGFDGDTGRLKLRVTQT